MFEHPSKLLGDGSNQRSVASRLGLMSGVSSHQRDEDREPAGFDAVPEKVKLSTIRFVVFLIETVDHLGLSQQAKHILVYIPKRLFENEDNLVKSAES